MADDSRKSESEKTLGSESKRHVEFVPGANAFASSGQSTNTAGAHVLPKAGIIDAVRTIHVADFKEVVAKTCHRESLIFGIGAGFAMGGFRLILRNPVIRAANWAVTTFALTSLGAFQVCQARQAIAKDNVVRAKVLMDQKAAEKQRKMEEIRRRRKESKEEADRKKEEEEKRRKSWRWW